MLSRPDEHACGRIPVSDLMGMREAGEGTHDAREQREGGFRLGAAVGVGFLCFLSPALFPERGGLDASIGLEYGFFASQARCWYAPASWCLCRAGGASS